MKQRSSVTFFKIVDKFFSCCLTNMFAEQGTLFLFSRAANTGWGAEEDRSSRWSHDKVDDSRKDRRSGQWSRLPRPDYREEVKVSDKYPINSKAKISDMERNNDQGDVKQHRSEQKEKRSNYKEDVVERRSRRYDEVQNSGEATQRKSMRRDDNDFKGIW
ncbi:hypothetical protein T459_06576 [Capsicum annuum]|uniref:Uncharacterized protein n=1 Tax=Capsicum annuum TaxID=4072 RepID=A0A2G3ABB2_CAPAN|nr:hypothetical protein T459_06576 [Capsicum annuum]